MCTKPPALLPGYKANFETLQKAAANGDLCLVSAIRKADRQPVALVCAMNIEHDPATGEKLFCPAPLAVMVEGNPYELFEDPAAADVNEPEKGSGE